jgi:hypothetical protein
MRRFVCLLALVFLASLRAAAQDSSIDLFAGYSYLHTSPGINESSFKANGGDASIAFNVNRWGSFVAEAGGVHTSKISGADVDANAETFLVGPKITFFRGSKLSPFAQALFGLARSNAAFNGTTTTSNGFAMSPGVGLDWNFTHHLGLRLGQVDYLFQRVPASTRQVIWNNFRYSGGVVFRF